MAGFASGEGCFFIDIFKISSTKTQAYINPGFVLTQHVRDEKLLRRCVEFFQAGRVIKNGNGFDFRISKFVDLFSKVLPIFKEAPIFENKSKYFND
jgi:hypothetical protein